MLCICMESLHQSRWNFSFVWCLLFGLYRVRWYYVDRGMWYISVVPALPNTFSLVLDSNLHDLNETNPDWRCVQQNYHGVVFCAEIKVLGMERNFARIFLYNKREFLDPRTTRGGHLGGHNPPGRATPSRRVQVGCPHLVARIPWNQCYKILYF